MKRLTAVPLVAILTGLAACGGGGGGPEDIVGGGVTAGFQPDEAQPGPQTVSMQQGSFSGDEITVDVQIKDTDDVYAATFDVVFNPALVDYLGHDPGTVLEGSGTTPFYSPTEVAPGRLLVVVTLLGPVPGVDVTGSQPLIKLNFRVLDVGQSPITFNLSTSHSVENSLDEDLIPDQDWFGGSAFGT